MDHRSITASALLALAAGVLGAVPPAQAQVRSCEQLRDDIASRAGWAPGSYRLEVVPKDEVGDGRPLGTCEAGARRIVVYFGAATPASGSAPAPAPASAAAPAPAPAQPDGPSPSPAMQVAVPAVEPTAVVRRGTLDEATLQRYREWIAEARAKHPYADDEERMFQVMMCESRGNAAIVSAAGHSGLFQYAPATWRAAWNTYAADGILDARAQIFATSLAWEKKNQGWWGCYKRAH